MKKYLSTLIAVLLFAVFVTGCNSSSSGLTYKSPSPTISNPSTTQPPKLEEFENVIVHDEILLGKWDGKNWINAEKTFDKLTGKEKYVTYEKRGLNPSTGHVGKRIEEEDRALWTQMIQIDGDSERGDGFDGLALIRAVNFGKFEELGTKSKVYIDYIAGLLAENGLKGENIIINQIVRTDLDNDGIDEVIISASNISNGLDPDEYNSIKKGQYSMLVMRKLVNGEIKTVYLCKDIEMKKKDKDRQFNELLLTYEVLEIADFNFDDKHELIVDGYYYEGMDLSVFEINGTNFSIVLQNGYGA